MLIWEDMVQGHQNALQFGTSILKVADRFKQLKKPIVKSIMDSFDTLMAGARLGLRIYLWITKLFVDAADQASHDMARQVLRQTLRRASVFHAILAKEGVLPPRRSMHLQTAVHSVSVSPESRSVPMEHTLCRAFALGRTCSHGNECKREHTRAAEYVRLPSCPLLPKKVQQLIKVMVQSGASPGHPAQSYPLVRGGTRSGTAARNPANRARI